MPTDLQSKPKNQSVSTAEFGKLRAYLARNGLDQDQIKEAVGTAADNRSRVQLAATLRLWLAKR